MYQKIKHAIYISYRAEKVCWGFSRSYCIFKNTAALLQGIKPYITLSLSAGLIDELWHRQRSRQLVTLALGLILTEFLFRFLISLMENIANKERSAFEGDEVFLFVDKILHMDYADIENARCQTLYRRTREDTGNVHNLYPIYQFNDSILTSVASFLCALIMVIQFFYRISGNLVSILLLFGLLGGCMLLGHRSVSRSSLISKKSQDTIAQNCKERDAYAAYLDDYENGKDIRIYDSGDLMMKKLKDCHEFNNKELNRRMYDSLVHAVAGDVFSTTASGLIIQSFVALAALAGKLTIGNIAKYTACISNLMESLKHQQWLILRLWYNTCYLERFFEFLDLPNQMHQGTLPVEKRSDNEYEIEFHHVSFRYPSSEQYVLKDIHMKFKIGERMAIVGRNGSGKTTFIKLLCRLYDPTDGYITLNGIDIRKYRYEDYLSLFSVVFQDFKLFAFSLADNVAAGPDYDEAKVIQCIEKAGLTDFLTRLPNGIHTSLYKELDNQGVEISGGEAQKLALARASYKNSPFILLDEPTAALDPVAEFEIYQHFNEIVNDRTTLYISHRLSSCRFCSDIVVFNEGQIIQRGSHEELIQDTTQKYYELWTAQAQYYAN